MDLEDLMKEQEEEILIKDTYLLTNLLKILK